MLARLLLSLSCAVCESQNSGCGMLTSIKAVSSSFRKPRERTQTMLLRLAEALQVLLLHGGHGLDAADEARCAERPGLGACDTLSSALSIRLEADSSARLSNKIACCCNDGQVVCDMQALSRA